MAVTPIDSALPATPDTAAVLAAVSGAMVSNTLTFADLISTSPFYVAHRGGGDEEAEHTLASYGHAVNIGIKALEVSVVRSADGQLFCMHDLTLDRTTTSTGAASSRTWADIANSTVDVGSTIIGTGYTNKPIPTLREVLEQFSTSAILFIEPKDSSAACVAAIFRLLDRYPWAKVVWKFATPTGGGLPGHAVTARARGYKLWSYLPNTSVPQADIDGAAANADLVGAMVSGADSWLQGVVATAAAQGKKVMAWEVHRRSEVTRLLALGVAGMMCSGPVYVPGSAAILTASNWAAGMRAPGELSSDSQVTASYLPSFDPANRAVVLPANNRSILLGAMCPIANAAGSYTISFAMKWPVLASGTNHSDVIFGHADDSPYSFGVTTNAPGYHVVVRANGVIGLYSHVTGSATGTLLGQSTTAVPVADTWMTFTLAVTPTTLTLTRTDVVSTPVVVADATYRGGYVHLCSASSDTLVHYRDVTIT